MMDILFQTENSPLSEVNRLVHDRTQDFGIIKGSGIWLLLSELFILVVWWIEDLRSFKHICFYSVWFNIDI